LSLESEAPDLKPSTTRPPRFDGEKEYDFVERWDHDKYAWSIRYGSDTYGMRRSEIERALRVDAVTVFEPASIEVFYEFRRKEGVPSQTIGLDTVRDLTEQHLRVAGSQSRLMTSEQFDIARRKVRECDVVLSGDASDVLSKVSEIISHSPRQ